MNKNYIKPFCEIVEVQPKLFCADNVSGSEEKQGYLVIDSIRDEMPD